MFSCQCNLILLTIDCATPPQSYHCVSNESGPLPSVPFSAADDASQIDAAPLPSDATLPISRIAERRFT